LRLLLPVCAVLLVLFSLRALIRVRSRASIFYVASHTSGALGIAIWPSQNAALVDQWLASPGFARLLFDLLMVVAAALQFVFAASMSQAYRHAERTAVVMCTLAGSALVVLWSVAQDGRSQLMTDTVHAPTARLLAYNVASGAVLVAVFGLCASGYIRLFNRAVDRVTRRTAAGVTLVMFAAMAYGVLIMAEAVADHAGVDTVVVQHMTHVLLEVGAAASMMLTGVAVVCWPLWCMVVRARSNDRQRLELWQLRRDILDANVLLSDRLMRAYQLENTDIMRRVRVLCCEGTLSTYQRQVALEAGRWLSLHPAQAGSPTAVNHTHTETVAPEDFVDVARRADSDTYFYADVFRVVLLALGADCPPELEPRNEPAGWRRDVADLLQSIDTVHGGNTGAHV
jgi:hypothetical protein